MKASIKSIMSGLLLLAGMSMTTANIVGQNPVQAQEPAPENPVIVEEVTEVTEGTEVMEVTEVTEVREEPKQTKQKERYRGHEFSIWGSGGVSTLIYSPTIGTREKFTLGGNFGLGYTFFFKPKWGISLGAELMWYNGVYNLDKLQHAGYLVTLDNWAGETLDIHYRANLKDYVEHKTLVNLNIPIAGIFQTPTWGDHKFFASLGFKFGIPVMGHSKIKEGSQFTTLGYSPELNMHFYDQLDMGFGTFDQHGRKDNLSFDYAYTGFAEAGLSWRLSNRMNLYTGLYFDYTFNHVLKTTGNDGHFLQYNHNRPEDFITQSILASSHGTVIDGPRTAFADKVNPISFGVKLRLGIDLAKESKPTARAQRKAQERQDALAAAQKQQTSQAPAQQTTDLEPLVRLIHELLSQNYDDDDEQPQPRKRRRNQPAPHRDYEQQERIRATGEYGELADLMTVYLDGYNLDQSQLSQTMMHILDMRVNELRKYDNKNYLIICEGHTCDVGTPQYNQKLGQLRAEIVREYLIRQGFDPMNVTAVSKGQSTPIVPNTSEENRKTNRRVVFLVRAR